MLSGSALAANALLTINGLYMMANPVSIPFFLAGAFLAVANGPIYGAANLRTFNFAIRSDDNIEGLRGIDPQQHGLRSIFGGGAITVAGALLGDVALASVGAMFMGDGALRATNGDRTLSDVWKNSKILEWGGAVKTLHQIMTPTARLTSQPS